MRLVSVGLMEVDSPEVHDSCVLWIKNVSFGVGRTLVCIKTLVFAWGY